MARYCILLFARRTFKLVHCDWPSSVERFWGERIDVVLTILYLSGVARRFLLLLLLARCQCKRKLRMCAWRGGVARKNTFYYAVYSVSSARVCQDIYCGVIQSMTSQRKHHTLTNAARPSFQTNILLRSELIAFFPERILRRFNSKASIIINLSDSQAAICVAHYTSIQPT